MRASTVFFILGVLSLLWHIFAIARAIHQIKVHNQSLLVQVGRKPEWVLTPNKTRSLLVLVLWVFWLVLFVSDK